MNKPLLSAAAVALLALQGAAQAVTVSCTVTSGTVLTSALGGLGFAIANGIGTSSGGATGVISCPAISTGVSTIANYRVLGVADYAGGPFGTTSGTTVREVFTLVGGPLNGSSTFAEISGGNSSTGSVPPVPFQIGSTLSGATSYAAFTVNVSSSVVAGGPVTVSTGQLVVSYDVAPVPEPGTWAMLLAGTALVGGVVQRRRAAA